MDIKAHNTITAMLVRGKQKKNPDKDWQGLAVNATVDGTVYSGIVFPKRDSTISEEKAVKFS